MAPTKWTTRNIDDALRRLGESYDLPPEQSAALDARIRREVEARFGSFAAIQRAYEARVRAHAAQPVAAPHGAFATFVLRPAFAFAAVAAVAVGATLFWVRGPRVGTRPAVVLAPGADLVVRAAPEPIVPGSGTAVSVFTGQQGAARPAELQRSRGSREQGVRTPRAMPVWRTTRPGTPLTPADGVFTTWGSSVFSPEEEVRRSSSAVGVFSS